VVEFLHSDAKSQDLAGQTLCQRLFAIEQLFMRSIQMGLERAGISVK